MEVKICTFAQLDKLIVEHRDDAPQKGALLILKSLAKPLRDQGITKPTAVRLMTAAKSMEELLTQGFEIDGNDEMYTHHDDVAKACGKVITIVYGED